MDAKNILFVCQKDLDKGRVSYHPLKDYEVGRVLRVHGQCESCGEDVQDGSARCENCGAEFGRYFDLGGVA